MRTTVTLDPDVHAAIKSLMTERGISFKQALNDAIRTGASPAKPKPFRTKTYNMGEPLVDLTHASQILAEMDNEEFLRKMSRGR